MAYRIEFSRRAEVDVEEAFLYIHADSPLNAIAWRRGLQEELRPLQRSPESFPFAPEEHDLRIELRQMLYGRYRVLYQVRGSTVYVLTVRHGARRFLTSDDVETGEGGR
jgi:plasmid stabilization system protein ParE